MYINTLLHGSKHMIVIVLLQGSEVDLPVQTDIFHSLQSLTLFAFLSCFVLQPSYSGHFTVCVPWLIRPELLTRAGYLSLRVVPLHRRYRCHHVLTSHRDSHNTTLSPQSIHTTMIPPKNYQTHSLLWPLTHGYQQ